MEPVSLQLDHNIAWIAFGDPATRNLLTIPLLEALPQALAEAEVRGARVVVLQGRGDIWSAGYDIAAIPADLFDADPAAALGHPYERCMSAVSACMLPTIAALKEHAFGGAVELAVSCDIRVASAGTRLGITAAKLGLVYPHNGLQKFLALLGPAEVRRLLFAAEVIDADEAARIGLVSRVVPEAEFEAAIAGLAGRIAACAPRAVQGIKRTLQILERGTSLSDADLQAILALRQQSYHSDDFAEGRAAFAAKRAPRFHGH